jgi:two-component system, NarL family, invasion response regulator UvrY
MKRILVLEAHQVVRSGLEYFIDCRLEGSVFGEPETIGDALILAMAQSWDVAVLGSMPGGQSVLEVLKALKRVQPQMPVLILSVHFDAEQAIRAYQAGAAGYITKDSPREELVKAITKVGEGRGYVSAAIAEGLAADLQRVAGEPHHRHLSDRELELVRLLASGKTSIEIAGLLKLSGKTVNTYRSRALQKMGMKSNAEMIRYAILNQLSELPAEEATRSA